MRARAIHTNASRSFVYGFFLDHTYSNAWCTCTYTVLLSSDSVEMTFLHIMSGHETCAGKRPADKNSRFGFSRRIYAKKIGRWCTPPVRHPSIHHERGRYDSTVHGARDKHSVAHDRHTLLLFLHTGFS